jgi:hypothetical protein
VKSALSRLQRDFQDYVYQGTERIHSRVLGTEKAGTEVRLEIYRDAYRLRLLECLENDYPALECLAGDQEWERLARAFIESHPSRYFNVRWYGDEMAEFLKTTAPWRERPALSEMAEFEWAMTLAFDAQDASVLKVDDIAAVPAARWPKFRFAPHPSLQRLSLEWNVPAFWRAVDMGKRPPRMKRAKAPVEWLLWRHELQIYFRSLNTDEASALDALRAGESFAEICAGLCQWHDEESVAVQAAALLKGWVTEGLIAPFRRQV